MNDNLEKVDGCVTVLALLMVCSFLAGAGIVVGLWILST
jgi:hypothetical protein